jgi:hypothetical protein
MPTRWVPLVIPNQPAALRGISRSYATLAFIALIWCAMLPVRCTKCGLINIPERQTCKRCLTSLQRPRAQDCAQVTPIDTSLPDLAAYSTSGRWNPFVFAQIISSPLPFTVAQQRLTTLIELADAGQLQRAGFTFHGQRTGDTFRLDGPHGHRSWPLVTRGALIASPAGAHLAVMIRSSWIYPIGILMVFGWWLWGAVHVLQGVLLLLPFVGLVLVVVMLATSLKSEGQIVIDMLLDTLSLDPVYRLEVAQDS